MVEAFASSRDEFSRAWGMSHREAEAAIVEHIGSTPAPVVLVGGPFGTTKLSLLHEVARAGRAVVHELSSQEITDRVMRRRLEILSGHTDEDVYHAAWAVHQRTLADPDPTVYLLVHHVDLLDEASLTLLDQVMRRGQVGVLMTSLAPSSIGYRYARALESPRGLYAVLSPLARDDAFRLLAESLEAPPTAALLEYLLRCSGGYDRILRRLARRGVDQGWIATVGDRSVFRRLPVWMDRHYAVEHCRNLERHLGTKSVDVLAWVAAGNCTDLLQLLEEVHDDDAVFRLAEAGLLEIKGASVGISRLYDRWDLLMGWERRQTFEPVAAEAALLACSGSGTVDRTQAVRSSFALLEQGLLSQARCVASSLPGGDPDAHLIEACASVCEGAPRRAAKILKDADIDQHSQGYVADLLDFIEGVLLYDVEPRAADRGPFGEAVRVLSSLREFPAARSFDELPRLSWRVESSTVSDDLSPGIDMRLLAAGAGLVIRAQAAALFQNQHLMQIAWDQLTDFPFTKLPVVGLTWVLERAALSRILISPGESIVPESWRSEETAERSLLYSVSYDALLLFQALVCGEQPEKLREGLEDLWAQFEGGLAKGQVSRGLLEAFDFIVEGERSKELNGPAVSAVQPERHPSEQSWLNTLLTLGRLLHCAPEELAGELHAAFSGTFSPPGLRRLATRCAILRRVTALPPEVLETLIACGSQAGVEPEVIGLAQAWASPHPAEEHIEAALQRLRAACPAFQVVQPAHQHCMNPSSRGLRAERLRLLSGRESEIAAHIITGSTVSQVTLQLGISAHTVRTHVRNIYRKLGVASRTELRADLVSGEEIRP